MRYIFHGVVHPERADVSIQEVAVPINNVGTTIFKCEASQISVVFEETSIDIESARILAKDLADTFVSALGFSLGTGYSTEIVTGMTDENISFVFGVRIEQVKSVDFGPEFSDIVNLSIKNVFLRFAVSDFVKAITAERELPFLCYRALENVRSYFDTGNTKNWEKMHSVLGTSSERITKKIKPYADIIRHGKYSEFISTTINDRVEILKITKEAVLAFVSFLKSENEKI